MNGPQSHRTPAEPGGLERWIQRTAGLQPWRRVFHAANGILIAGALALLPWSRETFLGVVGAVLVALFLVDLARLAHAGVNLLFFRLFYHLASPREAANIASSTWYLLGVWLAIAVFGRETAVPSILVLALADPAAGYVGRRWGRRRIGDGTLEGSIAFFVMCFLVLAWFASPGRALLAAALTAAAERLPRLVDDNVLIPLAAAASLWMVSAAWG